MILFDGLEPEGVYSVSTIGVKQDAESKALWFAGMDEAIKQLEPKAIIVYGGDIGYEFECDVIYIANHNAERISNNSFKEV